MEYTERDFVEPPKTSHKKKTEYAQNVANFYRKKQEQLDKPINPREPLKRTANYNWVHLTCAVFTPEVKFGNAKTLEPSEGISSIASARYEETCKACEQKGGACVACHSCQAPGKQYLEPELTCLLNNSSTCRVRTPSWIYSRFQYSSSKRISPRPIQHCEHQRRGWRHDCCNLVQRTCANEVHCASDA